MKATAVITYLFVAGICLGAWVQYNRPAPAQPMTFDERAGRMFDNVPYENKPFKSDRLPAPAYPDIAGGIVSGDSVAIRTLTFRPLQQYR